MTRWTRILTIVFGLAIVLLSVPGTGAAAQEAATAELSRVHPMTWTGPGPTGVVAGTRLGTEEEVPAVELLPGAGEEPAGAEQGLEVGDALVAVGGALVAGALADYVADSTRWGMTAPQAGALGGGALLALVGGFPLQ